MKRLSPLLPLLALAFTGTVTAQDALPGLYASSAHDFSFAYSPTYEKTVTEENGREEIKFAGQDGKVALIATFLPFSGSGAPKAFPALGPESIPSCNGTCSISESRTTELWVAPGLAIARFYYTDATPTSERILSRGPVYAVDIHPGQGDLLVFAPKSTLAESLLLSALSSIQPALSPRVAVAAGTSSDPESSSTGATVSATSSSETGTVTPPPTSPATDIPPDTGTTPPIQEEKLLFGIFSLTLSFPQMAALALGVFFTTLLVVIHIRQKKAMQKETAQLQQQR